MPINLTQLRADTNARPDHMPADIDRDTVLALIDIAESAITTINNWELCEDEGTCWHMAQQHLTELRKTLATSDITM